MFEAEILLAGFVPPSVLPGVVFPAVPDPARAASMALLGQLAATQRWPVEALRAAQLRQLDVLVAHVARTTARGRQHFPDLAAGGLTWERFATLPLLSRRDVQASPEALRSDAPPPEHGAMPSAMTSGSTGTPVVVERTRLTDVIWQVVTAREHLWHGRNTAEPLAVVRHAPGAEFPAGKDFAVWGPAATLIGPPGPCHMLHIGATTSQQLTWLRRRPFAWLLHYPSGVRDLLDLTAAEGVTFPGLRGVRTFGEVVTPALREDVRRQWGVPLHDVYSTQEVGYVALECAHGRLHVQSETVVVEVLRDDGTACQVGEEGKVVLTPLHNLAMPLLRYDIGDRAVLGPPCPCGRTLPVLERVLGRVHQTFRTRDGDRIWLTIGVHQLRDLAPVVQHQLVQTALDVLELRLVGSRPATADEDAALVAFVTPKLPAGTQVRVRWVAELPRTRSGKFLDFVSELA